MDADCLPVSRNRSTRALLAARGGEHLSSSGGSPGPEVLIRVFLERAENIAGVSKEVDKGIQWLASCPSARSAASEPRS